MEQSPAPFFLKNFSLFYAKLPVPPTSPKEAKLSSANSHGTMSIGMLKGREKAISRQMLQEI